MREYKLWDVETPYYDEKIEQPEPTVCATFLPDAKEPTGAVVLFPGGGYYGRAEDHEGRQVCEMFNKNGIACFMVRYRVNPYHYPVELLDAQRAVRFVRHNAKLFNIDPNKVGVMGFSAGGHLSVLSMEYFDEGKNDGDEIDRESCRPDFAILGYPCVTMCNDPAIFFCNQALLGDKADDPEMCRFASGEHNVPDNCPPVFIWHTSEDDCVNVKHSLWLGEALRDKKIPFEMHIYPKGAHGLGLALDNPSLKTWSELLITWLRLQNI